MKTELKIGKIFGLRSWGKFAIRIALRMDQFLINRQSLLIKNGSIRNDQKEGSVNKKTLGSNVHIIMRMIKLR